VRLGSSHNREAVRRIYSSETVELPPMSERDISVKSVWKTLPLKSADWLLESKSLGNGLLLARALLALGGRSAYVSVLNGSKEGKTVAAGQMLGVAKPAIRIEVPPASQEPDSDDNQHI